MKSTIHKEKIPNSRFGLKPACSSIFININHVIYQHFIPIFPSQIQWFSDFANCFQLFVTFCLQLLSCLFTKVCLVYSSSAFHKTPKQVWPYKCTQIWIFEELFHFPFFLFHSSSWFTLRIVIYITHCNLHCAL